MRKQHGCNQLERMGGILQTAVKLSLAEAAYDTSLTKLLPAGSAALAKPCLLVNGSEGFAGSRFAAPVDFVK